MACEVRTASIFLEAATIKWGAENLVCVTPDDTNTGGEYWLLSSPTTDYYVWTDINDASVDPAVAGRTGVEVDVPTSYTVSDYITAVIAALEAVVESGDPVFRVAASSDGLSFSVENVDIGEPNAAAADGDTGWTIETDKAGFGGDLGRTKEGIEVAQEVTLFDVTANQTGPQLLDQIIQGTNASLTASFLELTLERLKNIIGNGFGDVFTPGGGTDLVGFGTSKNFTSSFNTGGKLILHPVRLAESDRSRDVVFHKTVPVPESLNYDGTDTQALACSFNALVDETKRAEISVYSIGDWKQDIRA
jgi:hypothetical protein